MGQHRHIPSKETLVKRLSGVLEKAHALPGKIPGEDSVSYSVKKLRELLVQWRDGEIKSRELLEAADRILDGHGIEYLESRNRKARAYYVNMGDPYISTIILDIGKDRVWAGGWGDWLEVEERAGNKFD